MDVVLPILGFAALVLSGGPENAVPDGSADQAKRSAWLKQHAVSLRSLDSTDDDWTDLEPMLQALGGARMVLLGEASHGDGSAFLGKGRLVRFLHQRAGFDVLVWESGFYACFAAGAEPAGGERKPSIEQAVLPIWGGSSECSPTFNYLRATWKSDRPISLVGLSQYVHEDDPLFVDIPAFFRRADPGWPTPAQTSALDALRKHIAAQGPRPEKATPPPQTEQLSGLIKLIEEDPGGRIARTHDGKTIAIMRFAIQNLLAFAESLYRPRSRGGADDTVWSAQEGRNLLFWAREVFPDRKLIVWAHNGHIIRNAAKVEELGRKFGTPDSVSAADHAWRALGEGVYSIMFVTHGGETALWWDKPRAVLAATKQGLEAMFHDAGLRVAFLDMRGLPGDHWLRRRQSASPIAHQPMRAVWPECFDGLVFIDRMTPSTKR